ncbi:outer membrane beta-barrel family protein [Pedobacter cryophilus]|uniref:TonB-dependent receptor n=1 Tax=Pedobacter cryophilus TaxID=2571271 RepID=A0A4U1C9M3_9SPHI|nr:outer membrane beta-barrel family protein [Pedobacter cryophilus]TKC00348.1 TonB-dependent receptor [Pedobacter cryophilus]
MKTLKTLIYIFVALFTIGKVSAQNTTRINGKAELKNGSSADFATITLYKSADSTLVKGGFSDDSGKFTFENIKSGSYYIEVSLMGFQNTKSAFFEVNGQEKLDLPTIILTDQSRSLKEVVVTASKPFIERKLDKMVMNVENSSLNVGNNALEILEKAPGVTIDKDDNLAMKGKQGVLVMMDGKPTYMSNADLANMLRNTPSANIESIELITNPSAKYDAAGNAGIINIKTKKNKNYGLNGSISAGSGYGQTSKYNTGVNLNYRKNKINVFGNYNYGNNGNLSSLKLQRAVNYQTQTTNFQQNTDWERRRNSNSYKIGVDFYATPKTTIGVLYNGYQNGVDGSSLSGTNMSNGAFQLDSSIAVSSNNLERYRNNAFNANYKTTFDSLGNELSVDVDYSNYFGNGNEFRNNSYFKSDGSINKNPLNINFSTPSQIEIKSAKADFTHPISKASRLEIGWKSSWVTTDNNFKFSNLVSNEWQNDISKSNHFVYEENINAGYLNFNTEIKKTSLQFGLRAEQTVSKGNSVTLNKVVDRNYLEWFPSVAISQQLSKNHQLGLTYSRRIDRPAYDDLNPFRDFLDEFTYQEGNPFLNPQFTNAFEASYTYKSKYTLGVNYNITNDAITTVTEQNDETKVTIAKNINLDTQKQYGVSVYAPFNITKGWSVNNNLMVFYMSFSSAIAGSQLQAGQTAYNFSSNQNFVLSKTSSAEMSFNYQSGLKYGIFTIKPQYGLNLGFKQNVLKNKGSLKLSINDVFNTRIQRISTNFSNMNISFNEKRETQTLNLSFNYRFGKNTVKAARKRATGLEDESNRIKN